MHFTALLVVTLAGSSVCLAQEESQSIPIVDMDAAPLTEGFEAQAPTPSATVAYAPPTLGENYKYSFDRVFSPGKLLLFGVKAAMDQERGTPDKWGQGAAAYGDRYADHFGRALVRENLGFGVRALDGEDPRYELSHDVGVWQRSKHAIARTFITRGHNGQLMPAYSRLAADFGTPFIAQQWEPDRFSTARALQMGIGGLGFAVASNLGMEFWPDLRRKFLRH